MRTAAAGTPRPILPCGAQGLALADTGFVVEVPEGIRDNPPGDYAWVFRISAVEGGGPATGGTG